MTKPSLKDFKKSGESKNILEESARVAKGNAEAEAKPKKEDKEIKNKFITLALTEKEFKALEDKMFEERTRNRSAFVRDIIKKALNI